MRVISADDQVLCSVTETLAVGVWNMFFRIPLRLGSGRVFQRRQAGGEFLLTTEPWGAGSTPHEPANAERAGAIHVKITTKLLEELLALLR